MSIDELPAIHQARGPVRRRERALAPDLTRGFMLLFIALANCAGVVFGNTSRVVPASDGFERGINLFMFTFVNSRAYPVFAVMFGYGLIQLMRRQEAAGATPETVRSILLRRNAWLAVFGLLHGVLLYFGDFLGAYGLVGMAIAALLLRRGDRAVPWLWGCAVVYVLVVGVLAVVKIAQSTSAYTGVPTSHFASLVAPDYGSAVMARLAEWPVHTATVIPFALIVVLGMWAARRGILENPANHVRLLRWTASIGIGIATLGALPLALVSAGMLHIDSAAIGVITLLHGVSGMFGGLGYVALFGLLAIRLARAKTNRVAGSLSALGQRSLSGYLFQSIAWVLLLSPYTLALSGKLGSPTVAAVVIAVLVWLASLAGASFMDRHAMRGPAETLLRRLTYGRPPSFRPNPPAGNPSGRTARR